MPIPDEDHVVVPHFVGQPFHVARHEAEEHGLSLSSTDPDGPPIGAVAWPGLFYITSQSPAAGTLVRRRSQVAVEVVPSGPLDEDAAAANPGRPPADTAHAAPEDVEMVDLTDTRDQRSGAD